MINFCFMLTLMLASFSNLETSNATIYKSYMPTEIESSITQNVVVRQNTKLKCNSADATLYLYTNGRFKLISGDEALSGNYSIEDRENLVLRAEGYRDTYGKIYFSGRSVSRVVLGEHTYFPTN